MGLKQHTRAIEKVMNILVLIGGLAILTVLSIEMLSQTIILTEKFLSYFHLGVCVIFMTDFFVRWAGRQYKLRFLFHNIIFFLVSIPYLFIIDTFHIEASYYTHLIVRIVPLIRGIYGIAIVIGWITRSRITNLFFSYTATILATTYFASIIFYALEKGVNPMITTYWDAAIKWALMNLTTVGSNIFAVTKTGQLLSVFLAGSGMLMFPIFTAYITTKFQERKKQ